MISLYIISLCISILFFIFGYLYNTYYYLVGTSLFIMSNISIYIILRYYRYHDNYKDTSVNLALILIDFEDISEKERIKNAVNDLLETVNSLRGMDHANARQNSNLALRNLITSIINKNNEQINENLNEIQNISRNLKESKIQYVIDVQNISITSIA